MSDTRYFSREFLTQFIDIYRKHPALWMVKSKDYTNKRLKDKGHRELIELCKQAVPNADKNFVCKKIQSIRSCFRKELNKVEQSKQSGASPDDIYTPSLWYFDLLLFTRSSETSTSISNLDDEENSEASEEPSYEGDKEIESKEEVRKQNYELEEEEKINKTKDVPKRPYRKFSSFKNRFIITPPSKKVKSSKDEESESSFMRTCIEILNKEEDEQKLFGGNVAVKLKKMNQKQQIYAENLINQILYKGQLNQLSENTVIIENIIDTMR